MISTVMILLLIAIALFAHSSQSLSIAVSRGDFLYSAIGSSATTLVALTPSVATQPRAVDVGDGFDLLSTTPSSQLIKQPDAFFPISMVGVWDCERTIQSVNGDTYQAAKAWQALGGDKQRDLKPGTTEVSATRLIRSPYKDEFTEYTVVDRAYEYANRSGRTPRENIVWQINQPNCLQVMQLPSNMLQLDVVWRIVEMPNEQGWGHQEFWRISETNSPSLLRAVLVKRRFRRNYDEIGQRVVEGIEVVQTFRVLDGVAGTEYPTSTVKASLRWTRPFTSLGDNALVDVPSGAF